MNTAKHQPQLQAPRGVQLRLVQDHTPEAQDGEAYMREGETPSEEDTSLLDAARAALAFLKGDYAAIDDALGTDFAPRTPKLSDEDRAYYEREGREPLPVTTSAHVVEKEVRRRLSGAIVEECLVRASVRTALEKAGERDPAWHTTLAGAAAITVRASGPWEAFDELLASLPEDLRSPMVAGASTRDRIQGTLGGQPFTIEKEAGSARSGGAR